MGTGGQEDVGQGHRGRGDGGNGNAGTWDLGHNGIWGQEIWDVGTGRNGGGGDAGRRHRPSPVLTPNPTTTAATEVPRPPLRTGRGQRQQCPHLSPGTFLGIPRFTFASRGAAAPLGRASPVGGGSVPWHQTGGSPQGWWPSRRRVAPCVGGVLSPLMGGGEATAASVSLPLHGPPPVLGHFRPRPPQCHPEGGVGGGTPQNRAPIAQPKGTPLPPPPSAQRRVPAPPGGDNLGVGDIKAGGVTMW